MSVATNSTWVLWLALLGVAASFPMLLPTPSFSPPSSPSPPPPSQRLLYTSLIRREVSNKSFPAALEGTWAAEDVLGGNVTVMHACYV